uniref:Uncharacterized protein n=1 Tax=Arundo donax TaxID=35708 RepID=A0A0A9E1J3_ARUDO
MTGIQEPNYFLLNLIIRGAWVTVLLLKQMWRKMKVKLLTVIKMIHYRREWIFLHFLQKIIGLKVKRVLLILARNLACPVNVVFMVGARALPLLNLRLVKLMAYSHPRLAVIKTNWGAFQSTQKLTRNQMKKSILKYKRAWRWRFLFVGTCYGQEWAENLPRKFFNSILSVRRISSHVDHRS